VAQKVLKVSMKNPPDRLKPEWFDLMYNNRALVPGHGAHFASWAERSRQVRSQGRCHLDMRYGPGKMETLDVFPPAAGHPAAPRGAPVMVFIHGGYWRSLDKSDHSFIAPVFAAQGACVVMPNHDLCPAVTIPDITLELVHALAWTWRNAWRFGGDPARINVVGHSAGGHLAAMLLTCLWSLHAKDLPVDLVKTALSISGLYDLEPLVHAPFLRDSLKLTPEQVQQASPARLPAPARGTLYSLAGALESEEFLRQNMLIRKAWGARVVPVCEALPGLNHFSVLEALAAPGHRLNDLALQLLRRVPS
jgi:arylformamidase